MRNPRLGSVLGVVVTAAVAFGCGGAGHTEAQSPTPVVAGIGGGPRAKNDERTTFELDGKWTMTQSGKGLIGHKSIPLFLDVEGSHVLGHYHPDQGTIDGEIRGDVIEGSWKESDGEGTFVWKISPDGTHFSGVFTGMLHSQSVPEGSNWSGVKR